MEEDTKFTYLALGGFFVLVGLLYWVYIVVLTPFFIRPLGITVTEIGGRWEPNTVYEIVFIFFSLPFVVAYFWGWIRWNPWQR